MRVEIDLETLSQEAVPGALAMLAEATGLLLLRASSSRLPEPQEPVSVPQVEVLSPKQAAARLGRSVTWVYRHSFEIGGYVQLPGGRYGYDLKRFERWLHRKGE
jgi:DNA-directed RNA polymerase specialized sigma24 family protein